MDAGYRAGLPAADDREVVLRARDVRSRFLDGVDVELREGEVLGVAGLPGSGRDELPYALAGLPARRRRPGRAVQAEGSLPVQQVGRLRHPHRPRRPGPGSGDQRVLGRGEHHDLGPRTGSASFGWLGRRPERKLVGDWMRTVEVTAAGSDALITTLSGGNQQKVVMARCLARDPRVLVLCEPTAGVDVGTRQAIYEFIAERARAGLSLVVSSSDTGDLLAICTRVLVMCNGRVTRELAGDEITEQTLLNAMEETEQV